MKKFKFTLQPLLDLTLSLQEQLQLQMRQNEETLNRLADELDNLFSQRMDARQAYFADAQNGVSAERIQDHSAYIDEFSFRILKQEDRIEQAQKEKQQLVLEKINNYQDLKKLENLKEKQYTQYLTQAKCDEEKMIGDMISYQIAAN